MTIVSIKSASSAELRRIELSDGSFFWFKTCYLPPVFVNESLYTPGLAEGREISLPEEAGFRSASACLRAEKAALRLIARAEQCLSGLRRKLGKRGHEPACVSAVLDRLTDLQLVDDRRFARLWLESRLYRASSPRRLLAGLCARGIDRGDADAAIKAVLGGASPDGSDTEQALLRRFAAKLQRTQLRARPVRGDAAGGNAARALKFALKGEGFSTAAIQRFFDEEE